MAWGEAALLCVALVAFGFLAGLAAGFMVATAPSDEGEAHSDYSGD